MRMKLNIGGVTYRIEDMVFFSTKQAMDFAVSHNLPWEAVILY